MIIFPVLNTNESSWEIDALSFLKNRAYAFNGRIMRWLKEKLRILISSKKKSYTRPILEFLFGFNPHYQ